jgi:hypothetical protein
VEGWVEVDLAVAATEVAMAVAVMVAATEAAAKVVEEQVVVSEKGS